MSPPEYTVEDRSWLRVPQPDPDAFKSGSTNPPNYKTVEQVSNFSTTLNLQHASAPAEQVYHVSSQTNDPFNGRWRSAVKSYGARALLSAWSAMRDVSHNVVSGHDFPFDATKFTESFDEDFQAFPRPVRAETFHEDDQPSYSEAMDTWLDFTGGEASPDSSTPRPDVDHLPLPPLPRRVTSPAALLTIEVNPPLRCREKVNGVTCGKSFAGEWNKTHLHRHIVEDHIGTPRHYCHICRSPRGELKSWKRWDGLKKHMRTHHAIDIGTRRPHGSRRRRSPIA